MSKPAFAVSVMVGPDPGELHRLQDLLSSIFWYETPAAVLLMDDVPGRCLECPADVPPACRIVRLDNPRRGNGIPYLGGLACGVLSSLDWISERTTVDFVLKVDTDSLVIAPFAERVGAALANAPEVGIVGVIGRTCDRESRLFQRELSIPSPVIRALRAWRWEQRQIECRPACDLSPEMLNEFRAVLPEVEAAERNGYFHALYCQGGGYAVSAEMLRRLKQRGFLAESTRWATLPFGEDVVLGMYAYAVGMTLLDYSDEGQPFGVQWRGLAASAPQLLARGHAIIHSVKTDANESEAGIRKFFANTRWATAQPSTATLASGSVRKTPALQFYADPDTLDVLTSRARPKVLLLGSFSGRMHFGRLCELLGVEREYATRHPDWVPIPVVSMAEVIELKRLSQVRRLPGMEHVLIYSPAAIPNDLCCSLKLAPASAIGRAAVLHCYGAAPFHPLWAVRSVRILDELLQRHQPDSYVLSGKQFSKPSTERLLRHLRIHSRHPVGCRDADSVLTLERHGIPAMITGDDALPFLLGGACSRPCEQPVSGESMAIQLCLSADVISAGDGAAPEPLRTFITQLDFVLESARRRCGRAVLLNTERNGGELQDLWSSLPRTRCSELFPVHTLIDLACLAANTSLEEMRNVLGGCGIERFIGTSIHAAQFFAASGIPAYLICLNAYYRQAAQVIAQEPCTEIDTFLSTPASELTTQQAQRMSADLNAREVWWAGLE